MGWWAGESRCRGMIEPMKNVKRKRRALGSLGAPKSHHANEVKRMLDRAERDVEASNYGICSVRFTILKDSIKHVGEIVAHARQSGGTVAKGAVTPKTVSHEDAIRTYTLEDNLDTAVSKFRHDCVKR